MQLEPVPPISDPCCAVFVIAHPSSGKLVNFGILT